jgi:phosphoglycolate phosphatase-like HAD superfamily hydrolase
MLKLVGFDCDGVLFDSRNANIAFYNAILARFGRPAMTPLAVDYVHSHTFRESVEYLFQGDDVLTEVLNYCRTLDYRPFIPMMVEAPHLRDFLTFLRPRFFTAVATNRTTTTHAVLHHHGLDGHFDLVVSALDVARPKPHPESFWRIFEHFRLKPEEAIYIGDSLVDEEFAANAGVLLVAFGNPHLKAAYHLESFAQGPDLIRTLTAE